MEAIQEDAQKYRAEAHLNEIAHQVSAEHHRKRGVTFGVVTTALSAIVGTAVFVAATKFVVSEKGTLMTTDILSPVFFYAIVVLSILSPVLGACQQFLNDPGETEKHQSGVQHYGNVKVALESLLRNLSNKDQVGASNELDHILHDMNNPPQKLPSLTDKALEKARKRIAADQVFRS
jgi:hypothetical protein